MLIPRLQRETLKAEVNVLDEVHIFGVRLQAPYHSCNFVEPKGSSWRPSASA